MTLSVLFIKFTVALAAAVLLFACGTPGEPTRSNDGVSDEVFRVVSKVRKSMGSVHSYRVDGTITTYRPGGAEDTRITVRGDWVGPDRLELDVSGLRHNRAEYLIIVGDRAYQRERNTSTRDWSEWVEFNANSVDPAYAGGVTGIDAGAGRVLGKNSLVLGHLRAGTWHVAEGNTLRRWRTDLHVLSHEGPQGWAPSLCHAETLDPRDGHPGC